MPRHHPPPGQLKSGYGAPVRGVFTKFPPVSLMGSQGREPQDFSEKSINYTLGPCNLAFAFSRATKAHFPPLPSEFSPLSGSTHSPYLFIIQGPSQILVVLVPFLILPRVQAFLSLHAPSAVSHSAGQTQCIYLQLGTYSFPPQTPLERLPC